MASEETQFQLVTFQLGNELYGVNIMDVKEIVRLQNVRVIPNSPYYVEGIINLRGEIIPIIYLHKRFRIQSLAKEETDLAVAFPHTTDCRHSAYHPPTTVYALSYIQRTYLRYFLYHHLSGRQRLPS